MMRRIVALTLALALGAPAFAHLPMLTRANGEAVVDRWDFSSFPVRWNLNPRIGSNVDTARPVADVIAASFQTWIAAPNAALPVSRGADTDASAAGFDRNSANNTNLICFVCEGDFTDGSGTLAVTLTTVSLGAGGSNGHGGTTSFAGQIVDSDVLFNPRHQFTTGDDLSREDLQTIATHEIGHFFGLDHTGVVRAVMFPYAPDRQRTLAYDDVAGIATMYPKSSPDVALGSISGSVRDAAGAAVFGAHVFADSTTGAEPLARFGIRKSPISTLTRPDGSYVIRGVPGDSYTVGAEPLDEPVTNKNVDSYASAYGAGAVQTGFTTRWH